MNYNEVLQEIVSETGYLRKEGKQAEYIPELKKVNPDQFGMCVRTITGEEYSTGDCNVRFSIQSISKVFSLAMCMGLVGEKLWERMGVEPSGMAFNSVIPLEMNKGIPRNPFINSGAIVMADIILSHYEDAENTYLNYVRELAGTEDIDYNRSVAESELKTGYVNAAIANLLKYFGNIENDIEQVLRFYFKQCSLEMSCCELAKAFIHFSDHTADFKAGDIKLTASQVKRLNAIMQTCGLYDEAGEFSYLVGLPAKSGVGGGIVAVCPQIYSVAVWSPRLNAKGNSVMGVKALELFTTKTKISVF